jgi:hypothetical protein
MKKKSKKAMVVTPAEHAAWHKNNGSCGSGKEHAACMKKWGITIKKKTAKKSKKK